MTLYLKTGGAWRATPSGGCRIKFNGQWVGANKVYVKGSGAWQDSGYVGYPNPPQNLRIPAWDFSVVYLDWDGPVAGGAPVSYYQVVKTDQWGNWYGGYPVQANPGFQRHIFPVVQDERSQLYVRSVSTAGLVSGWAGPVRVQIGHTELNHQEPYSYTQDWRSGAVAVNLWNGGASGPQVPGNVNVWGMYVNLGQAGACGGQWWTYLTPGSQTTRNIFFVAANAIRYDLGRVTGPGMTAHYMANPTNGWLYISGGGGNAGWGLVAEGGGFASTPTSSACRVVGDLEVFGVGTYSATRTVIDRYRAENTTW